ncbi:PREDICTED: uncharacterized protein LOC108609903 isoform X1 [Drosophila arizonae]|uniref:Uncharacterized protein LOC108609903 isoform X1 n=1 Tax=Drosophila arizonae TaxID=7263 RepID=A0ABM1NQD4_DROAR|nr:PREDICTED: uncharacterized protein LOC108609903 isoform X1 [Drosophila arizonae]
MCAYKVYMVLMVLGLGVLIVEAYEASDVVNATLYVDQCPYIQMEENAPKHRLLGVWYAYATTPLPFQQYQRRCASYNVRNSPYFKTNILYYDKKNAQVVVTYSCKYNQAIQKYVRTLRILTRTRTPDSELIVDTNEYLISRGFNVRILTWLRANAFCFEWYELRFETERQPMSYQAPFNMLGPLGR